MRTQDDALLSRLKSYMPPMPHPFRPKPMKDEAGPPDLLCAVCGLELWGNHPVILGNTGRLE